MGTGKGPGLGAQKHPHETEKGFRQENMINLGLRMMVPKVRVELT